MQVVQAQTQHQISQINQLIGSAKKDLIEHLKVRASEK